MAAPYSLWLYLLWLYLLWQRFREAGLWRSDPDEYFLGKYLALNASVSPAVQRAIAAYAAQQPSTSPNNIGVHALALASHLAELRDALALARALRRTLVLPRWLCYCDRLWSPSDDIFHFGCMYPGAQDGKFLPFVCPMDHILSPTDWQQAGEPYRDAAFLESSRLPAATRTSVAEMHLLPRVDFDALPQGSRQHALPLGLTDSEAVTLLRPLEDVRVLHHVEGDTTLVVPQLTTLASSPACSPASSPGVLCRLSLAALRARDERR